MKNLIFQGGGVKGIAEAGAFFALEERGLTKDVERVAGTSAGAITACLVALKYSAQEIKDIIDATDFKSFEDGNFLEYAEVFTRYGIHPGNKFLTWIQNKIARKGLSVTVTFAELAAAGYLDLHVFATDLNTQGLKRFSAEHTPNVRVAEAIRASMSIPMFFHAFQMTGDDHLYVDGGCLENYPVTAFDGDGVNPDTIGICFAPSVQSNALGFNQIGKYIVGLAETILQSQNADLLTDTADLKRTIMVDGLGISATNFSLADHEKINLFESGRTAVNNYYLSMRIGEAVISPAS